jgi:hypothetical protein
MNKMLVGNEERVKDFRMSSNTKEMILLFVCKNRSVDMTHASFKKSHEAKKFNLFRFHEHSS